MLPQIKQPSVLQKGHQKLHVVNEPSKLFLGREDTPGVEPALKQFVVDLEIQEDWEHDKERLVQSHVERERTIDDAGDWR